MLTPDQIPLALAFDDVLLIPQHSSVASRKHVSTRTRLAGSIELEWPVISSNMDTVTMSEMAIAMALMGGIGLIHRFLPIDENAAEIRKVKRYRSAIIENPYSVPESSTVGHAVEQMDRHQVGGMLICDQDGKVTGILTRRDVYGENADTLVTAAMTPLERMVHGTAGHTTTQQAQQLMHSRRIEKLPLLDEHGRCPGLIVMKDIRKLKENPRSTLDGQGRLAVGGSIGVVGDYLDRCDALVDAGADVIVIDVAHGWADHVIRAIRRVRQMHPELALIVGNVATGDALRELARAAGPGCGVRVGIGAGSACDTRQIAGSGLASITSIIDSYRASQEVDATVIADGGIRIPADVAKAIGAGAHSVMIGSLLASAQESPGDIVERNGQRLKVYRGMASREAAQRRRHAEGIVDDLPEDFTPEGIESAVRYHGDSAEKIVRHLIGGLRSGMSYAGAQTIDEFHRRARFTRMSAAGIGESHTHVQERL